MVPSSTVDRRRRGVIVDGIVAAAAVDRVGAAGAVDHVVARAAGDDVGAGRARHGHSGAYGRTIDVLEVGDSGKIAGGLVGIAEVDRDSRFQNQRVGARAAVDRQFSIRSNRRCRCRCRR